MTLRLVAIVSGLLACLAVPARATVFAPTEWSALVRAAQAIVHGRVVDVQPRQAGPGRRVETLVTLQVAAYLKGDLGSTVTFRVPGGRIGRYRTIVLGAPTFRTGDEVVLLLAANGPSIPHVLGMMQGVFRVRADPASGVRRVSPVPVQGASDEWTPVRRGDPARAGAVPLAEFVRGVRAVLDAPGSASSGGAPESDGP